MPRAILKAGVIYPLEPLPPGWLDGKELWVDEPPQACEDLDAWYEELEQMVAENSPEDLEEIDRILKEADEAAKTQVRREMGLQ